MLNETKMEHMIDFPNATSINSTLLYTSKFPSNVLLRNFCLGIFGILANAMASLFMLLNKKVKFPLKVTFISLSFNDLTFSCSAVVYGLPDWTWNSNEPQCWPIVYVVLSTIMVSHCLTCVLALYNFVAVFFPLKSKIIITDARSGAMVVATWVVGYTLVFACFDIDIPENRPCIALALITRAGLGALCGIALMFIAFTIVINMLIFIKLRNRRKVAGLLNADLKMSRLSTFDKTHETEIANKTVSESIGQSTSGASGLNTFQPYGDLLMTKPNQTNAFAKGRRMQVATISKSNPQTEEVIIDGDVDAYPCKSNILNKSLNTSLKSQQTYTKLPKSLTFAQASQTENSTCNKNIGGADGVTSTSKPSGPRSKRFFADYFCPATVSGARQSHRNRVKNTRNTLLIMTCLSCLLAFPLIVDGFYLTIWAPDMQQFASSIFGILVGSMNTAHALANPLVYVWRFVDWRNFLSKIKSHL